MANSFNSPGSYDNISTLNFDLVVKTTVRKIGDVYPPDATYEIPILYPYANRSQNYEFTLANYGLLLKGLRVHYDEGSSFSLKNNVSEIGSEDKADVSFGGNVELPYYPAAHMINVSGMSFNLSDLYNAILYRNLKLQINKIRFALQEPNDVAYLNTLTMYSIGITSKIQKDSLNVGSFVKPENFNTNIVDVDMKIILDYNSILTYMINTAMVNKTASGDSAENTFRMSFFCNI